MDHDTAEDPGVPVRETVVTSTARVRHVVPEPLPSHGLGVVRPSTGSRWGVEYV